jgi:hypothetical protein
MSHDIWLKEIFLIVGSLNQSLYVNSKLIPVETLPGVGVGNKGEQWRR